MDGPRMTAFRSPPSGVQCGGANPPTSRDTRPFCRMGRTHERHLECLSEMPRRDGSRLRSGFLPCSGYCEQMGRRRTRKVVLDGNEDTVRTLYAIGNVSVFDLRIPGNVRETGIWPEVNGLLTMWAMHCPPDVP
jgi:hypothetical protein